MYSTFVVLSSPSLLPLSLPPLPPSFPLSSLLFHSFSPPLLPLYRAATIETTDSVNQPRVGESSSTTDHPPPFRTLSTPGRPDFLISPSADKPVVTGSGPRRERYQSQPIVYVTQCACDWEIYTYSHFLSSFLPHFPAPSLSPSLLPFLPLLPPFFPYSLPPTS